MTPGYTLPVWVALAARAATSHVFGGKTACEERLDLLEPEESVCLPLLAVAPLSTHRTLAMCRCEPGPGLDLTRNLLVWVEATRLDRPGVLLQPGAGVGRHRQSGQISSSRYARRLIEANVIPLLPSGQGVSLRVILPEGARLAERTSNAAFGVVEGLALIGVQARSEESASPDQLEGTLKHLRGICAAASPGHDPGSAPQPPLIVVIGANGLELAGRLGLPSDRTLKAGNWLGPILVEAALGGTQELLLLGYHGKLIKLAAGIFHTHHHLADGRREVLTAHAALEGVSGDHLQTLFEAATVDEALSLLERLDPGRAERLRTSLARTIETRAVQYVRRYGSFTMRVGCAWFERSRQLRGFGPQGRTMIETLLG